MNTNHIFKIFIFYQMQRKEIFILKVLKKSSKNDIFRYIVFFNYYFFKIMKKITF